MNPNQEEPDDDDLLFAESLDIGDADDLPEPDDEGFTIIYGPNPVEAAGWFVEARKAFGVEGIEIVVSLACDVGLTAASLALIRCRGRA